MKYLLILVGLFFSIYLFGQSDQQKVLDYKGGYQKFAQFMIRYFSKTNFGFEDSLKPKTFYSYNMTIDKNGFIKRVSICSLDDSLGAIKLYNGVLQSSGNWINTSGEDQILNVTIYHTLEEDVKSHAPSFTSYSIYYENGQLKRIYYYPVILNIAYPTQR